MDNGRAGWFTTRLSGAAAVAVDTDRPRNEAVAGRAATVELPRAVSGGAAVALATALTVFAAVLRHHTGRRDLVLSVRAQTAALALLPVRVRLDPEASFAATRQAVADELRSTADAAGQAPAGLDEPDPALLRVAVGVAPEPVDGSFFEEHGLELQFVLGGTTAQLAYDATLFDESTARRLLSHCVALLTAAERAPGTRLRDLPVLSAPIVAPAWTLATPADFVVPPPEAPGESLLDRFRAVVETHANRLAVTGPSGRYSYAELDLVSTGLARRLAAHGGPSARFALLAEHDIEAVVGILAVLKAGAAYVPLDPRQPDGRLSRLVDNAEADLMVCGPGLRARAVKVGQGLPVVDTDETAPGDGDLARHGPDRLAYLLHTSGSTGTPKAVMQRDGNVLAHALTYARRLRIGPGEHVPLLARVTFDAAVMDLFGVLLTGGALHVVDPVRDAGRLRRELAARRPTILHCTPTMFRHLLTRLPAEPGARQTVLPTVRAVVLGGEEVRRQDLDRFLDHFPGAQLVNGLGPTECTVALQHLACAADRDRPSLPVGHPVPGVEIRLLDEGGTPADLYGEIEIRSERVAVGYWNSPEETAAAFGVDEHGRARYRTGDLARRLPDGSLMYLGRRDRQIKIRGFRVEPGEIEAALGAHPMVAQAAVILAEIGAAPSLIAYVTAATAFRPEPGELLDYARRILPDYAVPARLVVLDDMPIGPTGKLDRARLPRPDDADETSDRRPLTDVEESVRQLWCKVLGVQTADPAASFMVNGGDSIRVLELLSLVRERFGTDVPLVAFLARPTILALAQLVEQDH